jgi:hypothetical protein
MRAQIGGQHGTVIATTCDYGNAVDLGIQSASGWLGVRLTMRATKKLAAELDRMTKAEIPPRKVRA